MDPSNKNVVDPHLRSEIILVKPWLFDNSSLNITNLAFQYLLTYEKCLLKNNGQCIYNCSLLWILLLTIIHCCWIFSKSVEEKLSFTDKSTKFRVNVIIMFYYEIRKVVWQFVENHWDANRIRYELQALTIFRCSQLKLH